MTKNREELLPENSGFDNPSLLDWQYNDVIPKEIGGTTDKVSFADLLLALTAFNQYKDTKTTRGCGWYGMIHNTNAQKILENLERGKNNQEDPKHKRIEWNEGPRPTLQKRTGTGIQTNLNIFRNNKRITGHARCDSIEDSKRALDNGDLIYTGSGNGDWQNTYKTGIYRVRTDDVFVGHIFCVIGYDEKGFIGWESNGPKYGKFTIPYDLRGTLYSKNAVFGNKHNDLILKYRTMSQFDTEYQTAKTIGITNGERENEPTTRKEAAVMNLRAANYAIQEMKSYIDSKFETLLKAVQK